MRLFVWPPLVDRERCEITIAPIHLMTTIGAAALILLGLALCAVLS